MGTTNLNMNLLSEAQAQKVVTMNDAINMLDAMAGTTTKAIANGTNFLTETEARCGLLVLTGALTLSATVVIPASLQKVMFIINLCTGTQQVTVQHAGHGGVVIQFNGWAIIWPDAGVTNGLRPYTFMATVNVAGAANVTLNEYQSMCRIIKFIGALTGNIFVDFPAQTEEFIIDNATTGAFTITIRVAGAGGSTLVIGQTKVARVYMDNINVRRTSAEVAPTP